MESSQEINFGKSAVTVALSSEAALANFASTVAATLGEGDTVLLNGPLAAGKTTFVRAVCSALGARENVTSPTYVIANIYTTTSIKVVHVDAYRLSSPDDFYNLGLDEETNDAITLVEWGDNVRANFPMALTIDIAFGPGDENARNLTLTRADPRSYQDLFNAVGQ